MIPVGVLAALALLLGSLAIATSGSAQVHANLSTSEPVELGGSIHATASEGGLLLSGWDDEDTVELSADRIHLVMERQVGRTIHGGISDVNQVEDEGTVHWNFTDVDAELSAWDDSSVLLVEPAGTGASSLRGAVLGGSSIAPLPSGTTLAQAGYPDGVEVEQEGPSYGFETDRPLLRQTGLGEGRASGSFQAFTHNVTIALEHGDGEQWRNWTGYREDAGSGPYSGYELRVSRIHVTGGDLRTATAGGDASLIAPEVDSNVDGSIALTQAEGVLGTADRAISLEGGPLELTGEGNVFAAAEDGAVEVKGQGSFEVQSPGRLVDGSSGTGMSVDSLIPGVAAVALLGAAGAVIHRRPRTLRVLPAQLRDDLFWRWLERGKDREESRAFDDAEALYRRSTSIRPSKALGWYHRSKARLEAGQPEEALALLDRAEAELEAVPLDLVEMRVAAAYRSGRDDVAREGLLTIADRASPLARGLVEDLSLSRLMEDPEVQEALGEEPGDGGLRGYV